MSQPDLLKKYGISESVFRQLTKKLLAAQGIRLATDAETVIMEPVEFPATSELVRHEVDFDLPAYDADRPDTHGMVREVSSGRPSFANRFQLRHGLEDRHFICSCGRARHVLCPAPCREGQSPV